MLMWRAQWNTRPAHQRTPKRLSSINRKRGSKFHPWSFSHWAFTFGLDPNSFILEQVLLILLIFYFWSYWSYWSSSLNKSYWSYWSFTFGLDPDSFRKKLMMICCVLISAPLGAWIGLKYIGLMWKGKLVFCNCYHQKVNGEPLHYIYFLLQKLIKWSIFYI